MSRTPAVRCSGCGFSWNSSTMAEGLRLLGSCPKCGGTLLFSDDDGDVPRVHRDEPAGVVQAPHLVLGLPRR